MSNLWLHIVWIVKCFWAIGDWLWYLSAFLVLSYGAVMTAYTAMQCFWKFLTRKRA